MKAHSPFIQIRKLFLNLNSSKKILNQRSMKLLHHSQAIPKHIRNFYEAIENFAEILLSWPCHSSSHLHNCSSIIKDRCSWLFIDKFQAQIWAIIDISKNLMFALHLARVNWILLASKFLSCFENCTVNKYYASKARLREAHQCSRPMIVNLFITIGKFSEKFTRGITTGFEIIFRIYWKTNSGLL